MSDTRFDERLAELSPISDGQFAASASGDAGSDLLARIVATDPTDETTRRRRLRHRLPVVAGVGVTAVAATAAIGWAISNSGATDTVAVQCEIEGADAVIPAVTGDPIADCRAEWQRMTGSQAPPLTAYDNGHGGITVAPASQAPAPGAVPLPAGTTQNVSAITLQETFDDYVAGLNATCRSSADAADFVRRQVDAAGLSNWTVRADDGADGTTTCADTTIVDAKTHTVLLRAMGAPSDPSAPYVKLAAKLRQLSGCRSAGALTRQVRAAAEDLGLSEGAHEFILTEVAADAPCAVVHETVGGTIFLTVRGPR